MNRYHLILNVVLILFLVIFGCEVKDTTEETSASELKIDSRSYSLGVIGGFAEVVDIGIKKLALSSPLPPDEMDMLVEEAQRIAANNNVKIYREEDFLTTDLFSEGLTEGKHVLLIYKGNTLQEYLDLKAEKNDLINRNGYNGSAREEIARRFGRLLSYPEEKIDELLKEK